ncbi:unnamed protein product [Choristocarpus tenellus]
MGDPGSESDVEVIDITTTPLAPPASHPPRTLGGISSSDDDDDLNELLNWRPPFSRTLGEGNAAGTINDELSTSTKRNSIQLIADGWVDAEQVATKPHAGRAAGNNLIGGSLVGSSPHAVTTEVVDLLSDSEDEAEEQQLWAGRNPSSYDQGQSPSKEANQSNPGDEALGLEDFDFLAVASQPTSDSPGIGYKGNEAGPTIRSTSLESQIESECNSASLSDTRSGDNQLDRGLSKEEKAQARKDAAITKKRERQEAVAEAKLQRERQRADRKAMKERQKETEKLEKAARKEREQQARGNFSHLEVACVMEQRYFEDPDSTVVRACASKQANSSSEEFRVVSGDCNIHRAVWWTHRGHLEGGAAAQGPGVTTLGLLLVVIHADELLQCLLRRGDDQESFPDLGNLVDTIRSSERSFSRLIIVLEGVEQELHRRWNMKYSGDGRGAPCSTADDLEDATSWLLIHKETETRLTKDGEQTGQYLWDLTRALSVIPYKDDVTELHCVARLKSRAIGSDLLPPEEQEMADTWVRMLQQIPGISEPKAMAIAQHYPLPRSLVCALSDPTVPVEQRMHLLADKMGSRNESKRSRRVYEALMQEDGDYELT